jgi:FdhD protein
MPEERIASVTMTRVTQQASTEDTDVLAVEEPLEIRVAWEAGGEAREKNIAVTMRTPGDDADLASGFLFTEGLIRSHEEIDSIRHWGSPNIIRLSLHRGAKLDVSKLDRHFYTTSSCGVCGKTSIDALRVAATILPAGPSFSGEVIHRLPSVLQEHQTAFRATGGIHGAAIFDYDGTLLRAREDIGRHNAVDKVIGSLFREGATPLSGKILMVSSRASFELVQKAIVAGIPLLASVGAPSSLAVDLAREFNLTLLGFVRDGRFNIYAGQVA